LARINELEKRLSELEPLEDYTYVMEREKDYLSYGNTAYLVERQIVEFPEKKDICAVCTYCHAVCPTGRIKSTGADPSFPSLDDVLAGRE